MVGQSECQALRQEIIALASRRFARRARQARITRLGSIIIAGHAPSQPLLSPNNVIRYWPLCKNADEEVKQHLQAFHLATVCLKFTCLASVDEASLGVSFAID